MINREYDQFRSNGYYSEHVIHCSRGFSIPSEQAKVAPSSKVKSYLGLIRGRRSLEENK